MTKDQLVTEVARRSGNSKRVTEEVLDSLVAALKDALLKGDSITFINFGKLSTRLRKGGERRNPRTGEAMEVPDTRYPHMVFANNFKKDVAAK